MSNPVNPLPPPQVRVEVYSGCSDQFEEELAPLLPLFEQEEVELEAINSKRADAGTVAIVVAIIGAVGPTVTKELFKVVRSFVKKSNDDQHPELKPVKAIIKFEAEFQFESGNEIYGPEQS